MDYQGNIIRPPSEADSLILQVTVGCSHNRCTFCPTYKGVRFRLKDWRVIAADIAEARAWYGADVRRVFVCDGDGLILKTEFLVRLFDALKEAFPRLTRIGIYGNAKSILRKTPGELATLKAHGLGIVYLGVESGSDAVLVRVRKGATREQLIAAGQRVKDAGIKLSVTILLGIGGTALSKEHAVDTGTLLTAMQPDYAGALTVMVVPGTELHTEMRAGAFRLPDVFDILAELKTMLEYTEMRAGLFMANHASNYLPLKLRMPKDRDGAIALIERVLVERNADLLKPEYLRAL